MAYKWENLQNKMNCFTVRNATMVDLKTRKPVRCYSANTRITVVQKCVTAQGTFYRTESAKENSLDWAFKASAFGMPDEKAPLAPSVTHKSNSVKVKKNESAKRTKPTGENKKVSKKLVQPESGGATLAKWIKKIIGKGKK